MPIYRQIVDQIKYQIATGSLTRNERLPSVRQLAAQLAVNQNTILKVYDQLRSEKILDVDRGQGTFVTAQPQKIRHAERRQIVARMLADAAVQAIHLDLDIDQLHELLDKEYESIRGQQSRSKGK